MDIVQIELSKLNPLSHNVRKHGRKQIDALIKSVEQFGQFRAMVVDDHNNILVGNGLYYALMASGVQTAECMVIANLSEDEKKKLILADNRLYELGENNDDIIQSLLREIGNNVPGFEDLIQLDPVFDDADDTQSVESDHPKKEREIPIDSPKKEKQKGKMIVCPCCGRDIRITFKE